MILTVWVHCSSLMVLFTVWCCCCCCSSVSVESCNNHPLTMPTNECTMLNIVFIVNVYTVRKKDCSPSHPPSHPSPPPQKKSTISSVVGFFVSPFFFVDFWGSLVNLCLYGISYSFPLNSSKFAHIPHAVNSGSWHTF